MRGGAIQAEALDIEPGKVRRFDRSLDFDPGKFAAEEIQEKVPVAPEIGEQGDPRHDSLSRYAASRGGIAQGVDLGDDAGRGPNKGGAQFRVGNNGERGAKTGDIVGLARRHERDRP